MEQKFVGRESEGMRHELQFVVSIAAFMFPIFWALDWIYARKNVWEFLILRVVISFSFYLLLVVAKRATAMTTLKVISFSFVVLASQSITYMIFRTGGAYSEYYAGLNLVLTVIVAWLELPLKLMIVEFAVIIIPYSIGCLVQSWYDPRHLVPFAVHLFFLGSLFFGCLRLREFIAALRKLERSSRDRLSDEVERRDAIIAEKTRENTAVNVLRTKVDLARQIAHDIRSPLSALAVVADGLTGQSASQRELVFLVAERIREMADRLAIVDLEDTDASYTPNPDFPTEAHFDAVWPLEAVVAETVSEKQLQAGMLKGARVRFLWVTTELAFARFDFGLLKRVLSNVINNALEAVGKEGSVTISVRSQASWVEIDVVDSGSGVAPEQRERVFERGVSLGKRAGRGLGLWHARSWVKCWGGEIRFVDVPEGGSCLRISLPKVDAPKWCLPSMAGLDLQGAVLVDDDDALRRVWQDRTGNAIALAGAEECRAWVSAHGLPRLMFVDFNLGESEDGLQLINSLDLRERAVMVSYQYIDRNLQREVERSGIRMLPKSVFGAFLQRRG